MMNKMTRQDVEMELIAIVKQLLSESGESYKREIRLNASLSRHLGIDSLSRAELFRRIEKQFDVVITDKLLAESETLEDIVNYLCEATPHQKTLRQDKVISHGEKSHVDPSKAKTLLDILTLYGEKSPDKPHIYFQQEDGQQQIITYGQLYKTSLRVANGLRQRGLKEGETVAIMQPTHPDFFYSFFGTLYAGGIPVPIYPPFRAHMLEAYAKTEAHILNNAEVRFLLTFSQAENLSRILQAFVPSLKEVTTIDALIRDDILTSPFSAKSDSFAFIQYTSGSTNEPKGVLLTHYNLISNIYAYGKAANITSDDVAVSWLPLYHDMGLIGMWLGSLYHGVPLVLMTPFSFLNRPERWLWAIHYHRGTLSGAPNFAYDLCIRKIDPAFIEGLDLSSWRIAANGAEKIYSQTLERFANKFIPYGFKRNVLLPVYGLAESTVALTISPIGREFRVDYVNRDIFERERRAIPTNDKNALDFVSCGKVLEGHEIRIVDDEDNVLPERFVGGLQFRGPSSMQGYYNNSRATQGVYHQGGWFDSGDFAYLADGELFITGRRKDLIIKAGRNIYPAEIEEVTGKIEGVRQGCVTAFGITEAEQSTEKLIVVAETYEKTTAKRQEIIDKIQDELSSTLDIVPDRIVLVAPRTVPKTSSGKLQRAACKTMYIEGRLGKWRVPAWWQVTKLSAKWIAHQIMNMFSLMSKLIYTLYVGFVFIVTCLPLYLIVRFSSEITAKKVCRSWARLFQFVIFCPCKVIGEDNLLKASPVIFASNHASYIDAIVALSIAPLNTRFVGKKELFSMPIVRTFMRKLNYLSIDRLDLSKGLEDTLQIEMALKAGHSIFIFPEGTFSYAAGLRPFRLGAFKVAAETHTPICPIALKGTRIILRDDEKLLRPNRVVITVCEPIMPENREWQDVTQLRNKVRAEIAKYCGEPSLDFIAAQVVAPKRQ